MDMEEEWGNFKEMLTVCAKEACGEIICKDGKVRTSWLTKEVKEKEIYYEVFLRNKTTKSLEEYRNKCRIAKIKVKIAKQLAWEDFGRNIEGKYQEGEKMFWKLVKNIKSGKKTIIKGIKNENGEIEIEEREILEVWNNYFEKLLNDGTNGNNNGDIIPDIETHPEAISILEVEKSIKSLKLGKAAGIDEIKSEILKYKGIVVTQWLHHIIQGAWFEGKIPNDWSKALIAPIYKKGNKNECNN